MTENGEPRQYPLTNSVSSMGLGFERAGESAWRGRALTVFLELVPELPEADPQELGGPSLNPAGACQGHLEISILDLVQGRLQIEPIGRNLHRHFGGGTGLLEVGR